MNSIYIYVFFLVIFLLSFIISFVSLGRLYPTIIDKRIANLSPKLAATMPIHDITNPLGDSVKRWIEPLTGLTLDEKEWINSSLRIRFNNAGFHGTATYFYYFFAKTILALGFPGVVVIINIVFHISGNWIFLGSVMFISSVLGYYLPNAVLSRLIAVRQHELFLTFPDALDLLRVCVEAGLGLDAAIERVGREMTIESRALAQEFSLLGLELRVGSTRSDALKNLALRIGLDDITSLVSMLVQADRFGTSMSDSLKIYSHSLRDKRRNITEEAAAKLPVKILLPLIFCVFPALLTVLMGPAVINIYQVLGSRAEAG